MTLLASMMPPSVVRGRYLAIGASETIGVGLDNGQSYPYIVGETCSLKAVVVAVDAEPSLEQQVSVGATDDVTLLLDINNVRLDLNEVRLRSQAILKTMAYARHALLVLMPPTTEIPGFSRLPQQIRQRWWQDELIVTKAAHRIGIPVIRLTISAHVGALFQPDGIHPTEIAQHYMAAIIARNLNDGRCSESAGDQ